MTRRAAEQGSELVKRLLAFARRQTASARRGRHRAGSRRRSPTCSPTRWAGWCSSNGASEAEVWRAYADSTQLELALMNLIINARDAMPKGGTIVVAGRNADGGRGQSARPAGGRICRSRRLRRRQRHPGRDPRAGHRALLHHQGGRQGHRPRPVDGLRLRPPVGRSDRHRQPGGRGNHGRDLAAPRAGSARPAEEEPAAAAPRSGGRRAGRCGSCSSTITTRCARPPPECCATWATRSKPPATAPACFAS